jgi:hypothetical protein
MSTNGTNGDCVNMDYLTQKLARLEARRKHLTRKLQIVENKIYEIRYPEFEGDTRGPGVYVLRSDSLFKIGYATDFASRLGSLQIGNPHELVLVNFLKCDSVRMAENTETRLHKRFGGKNARGEWYRLTDSDLSYIEQLRSDLHYENLFTFNSEKKLISSPVLINVEQAKSKIKGLIRLHATRQGIQIADLAGFAAVELEIPESTTVAVIKKLSRDGEIYEPYPDVIKLL